MKRTIWDDTVFRKAAQPYFDKTAPNPAYFNFESFLCEAFDKVPSLLMPDKNRTLFELRTYHSPNEEANQRKVAMFNKDEIDVFDKVGINSVCYGEVLAGPIMLPTEPKVWFKIWGRRIFVKNRNTPANTATILIFNNIFFQSILLCLLKTHFP